ncbi:heparinase II/III family protein [Clostridium transplantifaecale]|uniref:heparinase II/III family protein n=1 Tax=Clostridium transplantifaecale TaxID=2479838 RepID=UPI000F636910|nr:alginate lyase family protein [Clostridium transplantifaecale]
MADMGWLIRRLKAMSVPEILWRLSQKGIQKQEEKLYKSKSIAVTERVFNSKLSELKPLNDLLYLNFDNLSFVVERDIHLIGGYEYQQYKNKWSAGFQTDADWPDTFSYSLEYKQRDDIGDARTNWELNRHFQFALLAKNYYASGDKTHLNELESLFDDWNQRNAFLHGISWTSVMEVAIRVSNWCYAYSFLTRSKDVPKELLKHLRVGIINMTDYIALHYSRYSSANNHLIVEAYAIGQSGIFFDYEPWVELAVSLLTRELPLQNYCDGVNKELSLHYQSFYMEAMGLMLRLLKKSGRSVPATWESMLNKMCHYVRDCMGDYGEMIEFGDNDEGKILDLHGGEENHYQYVLGLLSCLLDTRYVDLEECSENLKWLFTDEERTTANRKGEYKPRGSVTYKEGGNSILRSKDNRVLIGIDHAALGFGSIAAHGHSDALSFQMYVDGEPIFIDPGTYIYHCDIEARNAYRKTENHNTVCIGNKDQSEMLGAFLWGKKAECKLIKSELGEVDVIEAEHDGYSPDKHKRSFRLCGNTFDITDNVETRKGWKSSFLINAELVELKENSIHLSCNGNVVIMTWTCGSANLSDAYISDTYGERRGVKRLVLSGKESTKTNYRIKWL